MIGKLGSGFGYCGEKKALFVGNFEAKGLHVLQSGLIASPKVLLVKLALGDNENVVRQGPRNALNGPKLVYPRDQHKSSPCHAQGTSLGDTAEMAVGFAKGASHAIVVDDGCVEALISSHDLGGATTGP